MRKLKQSLLVVDDMQVMDVWLQLMMLFRRNFIACKTGERGWMRKPCLACFSVLGVTKSPVCQPTCQMLDSHKKDGWPVTQRTCCLSAMHEVPARYRKGEKKEISRQCRAASMHKGVTSGWLTLPKWKIYSCWQHGQSVPCKGGSRFPLCPSGSATVPRAGVGDPACNF